MTIITLHGYEMHPGWVVETDSKNDVVYINRATDASGFAGSVTIDIRRREFDGGHGLPVTKNRGGTYSGRSWKKRIIRDACEWLEATMA